MTNDSYTPSQKILENYAKVLVHFGLGKKEGIAKGEVVECIVPDVAKPLAKELQKQILLAGGHVLMRIVPTGFDLDYYQLASQEQLTFFPASHLKSKADLIDHLISIIADVDPYELKDVSPEKIMMSRNTKRAYRQWLIEKENKGEFTWTLGLWGVEAKAKIVGLSIEEYWQQIIHACFLDAEDPIAEWRKVKAMQQRIRDILSNWNIDHLIVKGQDIDLKVKLGPERIWKGGADRNIPSFELFTSPDWRGVEGRVYFNEPLYRYGNVIEGVEFFIENGIITKATAKKGNQLLQEILKSENANKIGEFSLTDKRFSRITHPMAETLYDENIGGPFGNTHLAIGMAYKDCYRGDPSKLSKAEWEAIGYNDSPEHSDIVSTTDREVTAVLADGTQTLIYKDGQFTL